MATFKNKQEFLKKLDSLPSGPSFTREEVTIQGDIEDEDGKLLTETVELWKRDILEVIQELVGNPALWDKEQEKFQTKPMRIWRNKERENRVYGESWTGDWWNELQVCSWVAHRNGH